MGKKARRKEKARRAAASSPYAGAPLLRDQAARGRPQIARRYTAARSAPWRSVPIGADQSQDYAAREAWPALLQWARHLDQNNPVCVAILDEMVTQIVGAGIEVIPMPRTSSGLPIPQLVEPLVRLYEEWSESVDVTGELIRSEYERLECRAWLRDGEHFSQDVLGRTSGRGGYPFRPDQIPYVVEALESEMVPMDRHDPAKGWYYGVRMNQWRRPTGYAVYKTPPDDYGFGSKTVTEADAKEVPADRMSHLKHVRRWPAVRGVTLFSAIITTIHDLNEYEESERIAARIAASLSAYVKKDLALADAQAQIPEVDENGQPVPQAPRELAFTPGMVFDDLLPGEEVGSIGTDRPNTALVDFRRELIRSACGGVGCRYSPVARDFSGTYSSQRQELVEARPTYDRLRSYYIAKGPRRRRERMILAAIMDGRLTVPRGATARSIANAVYLAPAIPWIDKLKEVQADKLEIEIGLTTLQEAQARRGYAVTDPEEARIEPVAPGPDTEEQAA